MHSVRVPVGSGGRPRPQRAASAVSCCCQPPTDSPLPRAPPAKPRRLCPAATRAAERRAGSERQRRWQ
eukprot:1997711-Rhodomonas_salina.1